MKKIFILLLMAGLFAACNNDKAKNDRNSSNREKDDYNDRQSKNDSDKKTSTTENTDEKNSDRNNESSSNNSGGWTKSDETAWMKVCTDPLIEKLGKEKTQAYCSCVLEKLKSKYATYAEHTSKGTYAEGVEIGNKCVQELGFSRNKTSNDLIGEARDKDNYSNTDNKKTVTGWPKKDRDDFMASCKRKAMEAGRSRLVAESYCQCMMEKTEGLYPDINDAGKLTAIQIDRIIKRYKDKCLEEH